MVLDAYKTVYVWVGLKSNKHEKLNAIKKVESYVDALTDEEIQKMSRLYKLILAVSLRVSQLISLNGKKKSVKNGFN